MPLHPGTPLKVSLDFMEFSRADTMDLYQLVKIGMTGNAAYPTPTKSFTSIDTKITAMYGKVARKDFRGAVVILDDIKSDMRANATYVEANDSNDITTLTSSNYREAKQGGGVSPEIDQVTNLVPSNGRLTGTVNLEYTVPKGTHLLEAEVKLHKDPDTAFAFGGSSDNSKMLIEGRTKGEEIDIHVRAKGTKGYGAYSQTVTIIVQ